MVINNSRKSLPLISFCISKIDNPSKSSNRGLPHKGINRGYMHEFSKQRLFCMRTNKYMVFSIREISDRKPYAMPTNKIRGAVLDIQLNYF